MSSEGLREALGPKRPVPRSDFDDGWNDCRDFVLRYLAAQPATAGRDPMDLTVGPDPIYWAGYRDGKAAAQPATGEGLREALAVLRDMSDDMADGVLAGVKPDDIGDADWEAANEALRAALQPASEENR